MLNVDRMVTLGRTFPNTEIRYPGLSAVCSKLSVQTGGIFERLSQGWRLRLSCGTCGAVPDAT